MDRLLPFGATEDHDIELVVVDLSVARACWEGVPTARLLARIRLHRDERDLVGLADRASGLDLASSTWDKLMAQLLGAVPTALDRVKRAVAKHGRTASDEGPLVATDSAIAALVHVLLSASETLVDCSPAEGAADNGQVDAAVMRACGRLDDRLASATSDRRAAAFEACLQVATLGPPVAIALATLQALDEKSLSLVPLYPWGDQDVPIADRLALLLDRTEMSASSALPRELGVLAAHHGALVAFATREPRSSREPLEVPASSWLPTDLGSIEAAGRLAAALERGATTAPRARSVILGGGHPALDAIGGEMLEVAAHPFASAVFADILGRASRERDVVRLVSYFAIAPDAASAAHALAVCTAPDLPNVLRAWLESILPADGTKAPTPKPGSDPDLSASARLTRCIAALARYPHLHAAVSPLLRRTSEPPPAG